MEVIRRDFFNGSKDNDRKIAWVKWAKFLVASFSPRRTYGKEEWSFSIAQLNDILGSVSVSNSEDRWVWDMNGDGVFHVKDVRNLLDETFLPKSDSPTRRHPVSL
ncbi:hypothetical protein Tco_0659755 [Tanacetum coccineum]